MLTNIRPSNLQIKTADGNIVPAECKGDAILTLKDGRKIKLQEVHYVPQLKANLLSITSLNWNGIDVIFGEDIRFVNRNTGDILVKTSRKGRLPVLDTLPVNATHEEADEVMVFHTHQTKRTLQEWHCALGHVSKDAIIKLASQLGEGEMVITRIEKDRKEHCIDNRPRTPNLSKTAAHQPQRTNPAP